MQPRLLLPIITLLTSLALIPDAEARDIKVSGLGARKCSEWLQWKESQNGEPRALALEWAQGFIAGHNVYYRTSTEANTAIIAEARILIPLLDAYCQKAPESRVFNGLTEIIQSLGGAKVNLTPKLPPGQNPSPDQRRERES